MGRLKLRNEARARAADRRHVFPFRLFGPASLCGRLLVCALAAASAAGCAASRGADPAPARASAGPYPVTLAASEERLKASRAAWTRLVTESGAAAAPAPDLHPITATLRALPQPAPLFLPSVGDVGGKVPDEEETREALRRFLADAAPVLGVLPAELSLTAYGDAGQGGLKRAVYRQQPFEFPLRGEYGVVAVTFAPDRRVVSLTSTAVPDSERLRRALAAAPAERLTAERAVASIAGTAVVYTDAAGGTQTRSVAAQGEAAARELVVLPVVSQADPSTLELHLAWEVGVGGNPPLLVYVDAITGQRLAAWPDANGNAAGQAGGATGR